MRAELYRPDAPEHVVAVAQWRDGRVHIDRADDPEVVARIFRPAPVAIDDPAHRSAGTSGRTVVEPGDLEWFRLAAVVRGRQEGLEARLVSESPGGWDPALDPQTYGWAGRKLALPREP